MYASVISDFGFFTFFGITASLYRGQKGLWLS